MRVRPQVQQLVFDGREDPVMQIVYIAMSFSNVIYLNRAYVTVRWERLQGTQLLLLLISFAVCGPGIAMWLSWSTPPFLQPLRAWMID